MGENHQENGLQEKLTALLGRDRVLTDLDDRAFYGTDIYSGGAVPALVVRPAQKEQLANVVRLITQSGFAAIGRGGGTSYTGGIVPERERSVIVDTTDLNRIVEINEQDMFVTVEAGITWQALHAALKDTQVRTPFWGPFSGAQATVGGALSQNSILWGSTGHDLSAATVLGLEVALADGSLLASGSAGWGAKPFFRNYGPDLTGLFLGDTGALGIKATATLRLMRRPSHVRMASFNFTERAMMSQAMADVAREGVATTCFGMDPMLQYQRVKRASMLQGVKALKGVVGQAGSKFSGIRAAMRIAVAGRRFIDDNGYSFHLLVEGRSDASVEEKLQAVRSICTRSGSEIENSIPTMAHGDPFVAMTTALGPDGERWAPMHGLFPLSQGDAAWARIEKLFDDYASEFDRLGIVAGVLLALVSSNVFVVEPVLYWPGPRTVWYERNLDAGQLAKYKRFEDDPEVNSLVSQVRTDLLEIFGELKAMHLQIGKKYEYAQRAMPANLELIEGIKTLVDPSRLMNPGSLGLK